jgi:hypothetical protein
MGGSTSDMLWLATEGEELIERGILVPGRILSDGFLCLERGPNYDVAMLCDAALREEMQP